MMQYITRTYYNQFTKDIVANDIKSKELVNKFDIAGFINNAELDKKKVATLATKAELKAEQDKIIKLQPLIQVIFEVKIILKMMVLKII